MIYQVNKPFHLSTNPENWVKIGQLDSEKQVLENRALKIYKRQARSESLPSELKKIWHTLSKEFKILLLMTSSLFLAPELFW